MEENNPNNHFENLFIKFKIILKIMIIIFMILIFIELFAFIGGIIHRYSAFDYRQDVFYPGLMKLNNNNEIYVKSIIEDFRGVTLMIHLPYVYYKPVPCYKSQSINLDSNSLRVNGDKKCFINGKPIKIFIFGGSTMFGAGIRDDETIPAYLYEYLCKNNISAEVINYGVFGWTSQSEIIEFQRQIEKGNVPNIVIFYDGLNDVYSVMRNQEVGYPPDYKNEQSNPKKINFFQWYSSYSYIHQLMKYLIPKNTLNNDAINKSLQEQEVLFYVNQAKIIKSMEKTFEFKSFFFWQPSIWQKSPLSEFEYKMNLTVSGSRSKNFGNDYISITQIIKKYPEVIDISNSFKNNNTIFIDEIHISKEGNEIIAKNIGKEVINFLKSKK